MNGSRNSTVRTEENVVPDLYGTAVQYRKIKIGVAAFAELGENSVIKIYGTLQKSTLSAVGDKLVQNGLAELLLVLKGILSVYLQTLF